MKNRPTRREQLNIRLTKSDRKELELLARCEKSNMSEIVRALVKAAAQQRGILPSETEMRREGIPC